MISIFPEVKNPQTQKSGQEVHVAIETLYHNQSILYVCVIFVCLFLSF